ncbi:hypothetical protein BO78DRAFT_421087 [Aspergillus sclerotiicarbonarius CBS 121057]|uniref:Zn(2)-C6 fungal-type domain-containing protein n=1 Tax=Aspergillus sclerotiicarbonarius (strain CBS 121057 / IBT 28362) TaxID=1448318 RepID=A0A319E1R1_ASPSB|nr:hypothetical protein BO78DRAFT_421087 [Aspergillus sclerotiicarbonarius CBS 121057]
MSAEIQGSEPLHKACDACRARKTRCKLSGSADACEFCLSQARPCSFTPVKRPRKRKYDPSGMTDPNYRMRRANLSPQS